MKTNCWFCDKHTEMKELHKSKTNKRLWIGCCQFCGVQLYQYQKKFNRKKYSQEEKEK